MASGMLGAAAQPEVSEDCHFAAGAKATDTCKRGKGIKLRKQQSPSKSASVYRGVAYVPRSGRWRTTFKHKTFRYCLGTFSTPEEAARVWDLAAIKSRGPDFTDLNFGRETYAHEAELLERYTFEQTLHLLKVKCLDAKRTGRAVKRKLDSALQADRALAPTGPDDVPLAGHPARPHSPRRKGAVSQLPTAARPVGRNPFARQQIVIKRSLPVKAGHRQGLEGVTGAGDRGSGVTRSGTASMDMDDAFRADPVKGPAQRSTCLHEPNVGVLCAGDTAQQARVRHAASRFTTLSQHLAHDVPSPSMPSSRVGAPATTLTRHAQPIPRPAHHRPPAQPQPQLHAQRNAARGFDGGAGCVGAGLGPRARWGSECGQGAVRCRNGKDALQHQDGLLGLEGGGGQASWPGPARRWPHVVRAGSVSDGGQHTHALRSTGHPYGLHRSHSQQPHASSSYDSDPANPHSVSETLNEVWRSGGGGCRSLCTSVPEASLLAGPGPGWYGQEAHPGCAHGASQPLACPSHRPASLGTHSDLHAEPRRLQRTTSLDDLRSSRHDAAPSICTSAAAGTVDPAGPLRSTACASTSLGHLSLELQPRATPDGSRAASAGALQAAPGCGSGAASGPLFHASAEALLKGGVLGMHATAPPHVFAGQAVSGGSYPGPAWVAPRRRRASDSRQPDQQWSFDDMCLPSAGGAAPAEARTPMALDDSCIPSRPASGLTRAVDERWAALGPSDSDPLTSLLRYECSVVLPAVQASAAAPGGAPLADSGGLRAEPLASSPRARAAHAAGHARPSVCKLAPLAREAHAVDGEQMLALDGLKPDDADDDPLAPFLLGDPQPATASMDDAWLGVLRPRTPLQPPGVRSMDDLDLCAHSAGRVDELMAVDGTARGWLSLFGELPSTLPGGDGLGEHDVLEGLLVDDALPGAAASPGGDSEQRDTFADPRPTSGGSCGGSGGPAARPGEALWDMDGLLQGMRKRYAHDDHTPVGRRHDGTSMPMMIDQGRSIAAEWLQVPLVPLPRGAQCHDDCMHVRAASQLMHGRGHVRRSLEGEDTAATGRAMSLHAWAGKSPSQSSFAYPGVAPLGVASSRASEGSELQFGNREGLKLPSKDGWSTILLPQAEVDEEM